MMRQLQYRAASFGLFVFGICAVACSLDQRSLQHGVDATGGSAGQDNGAAGTRTTAGTTSGSGGTQADAGKAGMNEVGAGGAPSTPGLPPLVNGCADLDSDGVGDCTVTLVKNPSFATDVGSWTAVDAATLAWDPDNALGDKPSGCAHLGAQGTADTSGVMIFRAAQCVAVPAGQIVVAYANARVEQPAGASDLVRAELEVSYFDAADCTGTSSGYFVTPPSEAVGTWVTIQAGRVSGPTTTAVSVALVATRPNASDELSVCFDNVMLEAKPLP